MYLACNFRVVESKHSDYPVGTVITGGLGWSTHTIIDPKTASVKDAFLKKVPEGVAPSHAMSVFGLTGWALVLFHTFFVWIQDFS